MNDKLPDNSTRTIAFIGGGNMALSLIAGLVADGYDEKKIIVSDKNRDQLASLSARFGIHSAADNPQAVRSADVVVFAVKPQVLETVARELSEAIRKRRPLVVSIAAGIREKSLESWLGGEVSLVRTMPNTPAMIQAGATVLHANHRVSAEQRDLAETILRAVGLTCWVEDESLLDVVTALSGSGPAYFFLVMEAMEQAALDLGLPADSARLLTLQTALGAARMAMESSEGPAGLRHKVTSPGGTTERALEVLEGGGLRALFKEAVAAAKERSEELSRMLGKE